MKQVNIRQGTVNDMDTVYEMIVELAIYEKLENEVAIDAAQLKADGFGERPLFEVLIAEAENEIIGFALCYVGYSTWKGRCWYLEDFLVKEAYRGKGIGGKLFEAVIARGKALGVGRMDWQVLDWNAPAIGFYEKYGAKIESGWLNGRFYAEQLDALKC